MTFHSNPCSKANAIDENIPERFINLHVNILVYYGSFKPVYNEKKINTRCVIYR